MLCYEVNATYLPSGELPWDERLRRIAEANFTAVEILFPQRENVNELASLLARYQLRLALLNTEPDPEYPRGHLTMPEAEDRFWMRFDEAVAVAKRLGAHRIHVLSGKRIAGLPHEQQVAVAVERLRRAGTRVADDGITLLVEMLNEFDTPGDFVTHSAVGLEIVDAVGLPNVLFQHDFYHMQVMEGNLIESFRQHWRKVGHVQVADAPGRQMPGRGEINLLNVLQSVEATGYHGYVGLEYWPPPDGSDPFAWLPVEWRRRTLNE